MQVKILSVEIVKGSTINPTWHSDMQLIETDKGMFIDNMPGKKYGHPGAPTRLRLEARNWQNGGRYDYISKKSWKYQRLQMVDEVVEILEENCSEKENLLVDDAGYGYYGKRDMRGSKCGT